MIEAQHIGKLFSVMRASYGHLWPHGSAEDAAIWLRKLGGYTWEEVAKTADRMPKMYPDHPPTIGQFDAAIGGSRWVNSTLIEDQRPSGKMPFSEWKRLNGVEE
jgi:hypothetical protein